MVFLMETKMCGMLKKTLEKMNAILFLYVSLWTQRLKTFDNLGCHLYTVRVMFFPWHNKDIHLRETGVYARWRSDISLGCS